MNLLISSVDGMSGSLMLSIFDCEMDRMRSKTTKQFLFVWLMDRLFSWGMYVKPKRPTVLLYHCTVPGSVYWYRVRVQYEYTRAYAVVDRAHHDNTRRREQEARGFPPSRAYRRPIPPSSAGCLCLVFTETTL